MAKMAEMAEMAKRAKMAKTAKMAKIAKMTKWQKWHQSYCKSFFHGFKLLCFFSIYINFSFPTFVQEF